MAAGDLARNIYANDDVIRLIARRSPPSQQPEGCLNRWRWTSWPGLQPRRQRDLPVVTDALAVRRAA